MDRLPWRKITWPLFGLFLVGVFIAITVSILHMAFHAGAPARLLAAMGWAVAFVGSWRAFRRSHGDARSTQPSSGRLFVKQQRWVVALGVGVVGVLLDVGGDAQMIGLALLSGFMWPGLYWMTRSILRHPELRQRLWSGQLRQL